jgi:hypothetical protein
MPNNTILGLIVAVLAIAAIAFGINTGGGLGDGPTILNCLLIYELLLILILIWLVVCVRRCNPEDGRCATICFRRAIYMWAFATVLLWICIAGHPI